MNLSDRAAGVWKKLQKTHPNKLQFSFPQGMTAEMAELVDGLKTPEELRAAVERLLTHKRPPTLQQFRDAMTFTPVEPPKPNVMALLTQYIVDYHRPSLRQLQLPWEWRWNGSYISSVMVPGDGVNEPFIVKTDVLQMLNGDQMKKLKRLDVVETREKARLLLERTAAGMRA